MVNGMFWIFLAATVVASLTFVAVIVWAESRRKERQEYYRYEFRKRLVDAGKMDAVSFASLVRYEQELLQQQGREKLLVASFVILGIGVGTCIGLQFISGSIWMVGLIPVCMGLSMLTGGLFFANKSNPGPPPLGWSPEPNERD